MKDGIKKIFNEVSDTYEKINHILTFGMDIVCRKRTAKIAVTEEAQMLLDVCTGTGETAVYLKKYSKSNSKVTAVDFSKKMLSKAIEKQDTENINFILSDVKNLPLKSGTFDTVTISFATRNINLNRNILIKTFVEFSRVLKPGGRFINLETSRPKLLLIKIIMDIYVKLVVKPVGYLISGSMSGYKYLSSTIPRFFTPEELSLILKEAGFGEVKYKRLFLGAAALHISVK